MAKRHQRSNREAKKPKQVAKKTETPATSLMVPGKGLRAAGSKS